MFKSLPAVAGGMGWGRLGAVAVAAEGVIENWWRYPPLRRGPAPWDADHVIDVGRDERPLSLNRHVFVD